jgi:hypothetical protein
VLVHVPGFTVIVDPAEKFPVSVVNVGATVFVGRFATVTVAVASSPYGTGLTVTVYVPVLLYDQVLL